MVIGNPSLYTSKVILFYAGITDALKEEQFGLHFNLVNYFPIDFISYM
jgi:hypothetical protein